jgi:glyoxylate/succinic semialdehyde reductase
MACMLASFSEGLTLADRSGLSKDDLIKILGLGAMANPMFNLKGPKILADGAWACVCSVCVYV